MSNERLRTKHKHRFNELGECAVGDCDALPPDWCWSCSRREPIPEDTAPYIVCHECGHVYLTGEALVRRYNAEARRLNVEYALGVKFQIDPDRIGFCQECLRDF